jgi:hypothetical protein
MGRGNEGEGFVMGHLALRKEPARWGFATMDKEPTFQVRDFFIQQIYMP